MAQQASINTIVTSLRAFGYNDSLSEDIVDRAVKTDVILFSRLVGWLSGELHVLLNLEDIVEEIENVDDAKNFYSYLSVFLSELGCSIPELINAPAHQRFHSESVKLLVLQYLLSQVKPARLIALKRLQKQELEESTKPKDPLKELAKKLVQLNVRPSQVTDQNELVNILKSELTKSFNGLVRRPKPLFVGKFTDKQWAQLNNFAQMMTNDYKVRMDMLLKRLDVTVESFLWSDKVHHLERQVMRVYLPGRHALGGWKPIGIDELIGATEDILVIDKASSNRQRAHTKSKISKFTLNQIPADRGGRTDTIIPPPQESFKDQYRDKNRKGKPHTSRKFNEQNQRGLENQVKKEYQSNEQGKSYANKTFYKTKK